MHCVLRAETKLFGGEFKHLNGVEGFWFALDVFFALNAANCGVFVGEQVLVEDLGFFLKCYKQFLTLSKILSLTQFNVIKLCSSIKQLGYIL